MIDRRAHGVGVFDGVGLGGAKLGLVEVALESSFENVEGCCEGCGCHAPDTGE